MNYHLLTGISNLSESIILAMTNYESDDMLLELPEVPKVTFPPFPYSIKRFFVEQKTLCLADQAGASHLILDTVPRATVS